MRRPIRSGRIQSTPAVQGPLGMPRLLRGLKYGTKPLNFEEHLAQWGPMYLHNGEGILAEVEASGLLGHGGASFPVGIKWRAIKSQRRRSIVVANGSEGEPASAKDALLLMRAPHLVLDGAVAAAGALDATRVVLYTGAMHVGAVSAALAQRQRAGVDPVKIEVATAPEAFVAGQETAVVGALNGKSGAIPLYSGIHSIRERGVSGRPTLVQNVETLAHVALIARYGAQWFRSLGSSDSPGTMLLSVTGRWSETVVVEAAYTTPMREILGLTPSEIAHFQGANLGGYGGSWVSMKTLMSLTLSESVARDANATLGASIVILLPRDVCPVSEVARVAHYMRDEGAGQCGPCVNGLAEIADLLGGIVNVAARRRKPAQVGDFLELCNLVEGRGACRHPDGVARFVRSAISVFDSHFNEHFHSSPCAQAGSYGVLPLPAPNHRRMVSTSRGAK